MPSKTVWKRDPFSIIEVIWLINGKPPRTTWHITELYSNYQGDRRSQHQVGEGYTTFESALTAAEALLARHKLAAQFCETKGA